MGVRRELGAFAAWIGFGLALGDGPSVEEALAAFRLADATLKIELVAAEPDVLDPVAITWDAERRLYVVEMRDYPVSTTGGAIRRLIDGDGDRRYEGATLFAEGLPYPSSALPWRDGLLVTAAPDILFLRDTDDDGVADERRVVLTGFGEGNQQLRVNGLMFGLDNWVYAANGRSDGMVRRPGDPIDGGVNLRRHDLRFNPDTGALELVAGFSQFGLCRDDWGDRFTSWNTVPWRHVVLEERYLTRNPFLAETNCVAPILDPSDTGRLYPVVPPQQRFNRETVEFFNASCGPTVYRGNTLRGYAGDVFVCEPLTSLVHHRRLRSRNASFTAARPELETGREFLASTHPWFRPVNLATGPDGGLYVVDFCREWVEHPAFVPEEYRDAIDFRIGADRGRIWRISPRNDVDAAPAQSPRYASVRELVKLLEHPNGWWRDTAQRLLVERADTRAVGPLRQLFARGKTDVARLHALYALHALGGIDDELLQKGFSDSSAQVRRHALMLAESRLRESKGLAEAMMGLADDADIRVRAQAALSAGELKAAARLPTLVRLAAGGVADSWYRLALLSSAGDVAWPMMRALIESSAPGTREPANGSAELLAGLAEIVAAADRPGEVDACLAWLARDMERRDGDVAVASGLIRGFERAGRSFRERLERATIPAGGNGGDSLSALAEYAVQVAGNGETEETLRTAALDVISAVGGASHHQALVDFLFSSENDRIRAAIAGVLCRKGEPELLGPLFEKWDQLSPGLRRAMAGQLVSSPNLAGLLLDNVERGLVSPRELDSTARERLLGGSSEAVRERATRLLAERNEDKRALIERYQTALEMEGDRERGAVLFAENCASCHVMLGMGHSVGPELSGITSRPKAQLLVDILDPGREVAPDYVCYVLQTADDEVITGVLAGESERGVTLRQSLGMEQWVPRPHVKELRASALSLMPDGLEAVFDPRAMADLLAFLHRPFARGAQGP